MFDPNQVKGEVYAAEEALKPYQDPNLMTQTKQAVQEQWTPLLKSSVNAAQSMMSDFLPRYMGMAENLGGTSESDISAGSKLQLMGQGQLS